MFSPPDCAVMLQDMGTARARARATMITEPQYSAANIPVVPAKPTGRADARPMINSACPPLHSRLLSISNGGHGAKNAPLPTLRFMLVGRQTPSALYLQLFRRLRCEVSQDAVGAGALER